MRIIRHLRDLPDSAQGAIGGAIGGALGDAIGGAVVAIGDFDGLLRGHQAVIAEARRRARALGAPSVVVAIAPQPRSDLEPVTPPLPLTPFRIKMRLLAALGVDHLVFPPIDRAWPGQNAEAFVREVLLGGLQVRHLVAEEGFVLGRERSGVSRLEEMGRSLGFGVSRVARDQAGSEDSPAVAVRAHLAAGEPGAAARLLGRYFEIEGRVRRGDARGRSLGFPTANIALGQAAPTAFGIYAVRAAIDRARPTWRAGVASLGVRPTFGANEPLLEVHFFDFDGDLYGRRLRVALVDFLRPEIKFDGVAPLKIQMAEDARRARRILASEAWDGSWPADPALVTGQSSSGFCRR